jgi:hypothetical protein
MWFFYLFSLIPVAIGAYLFYKNNTIIWGEWVGGTVAAFVLAGIMHCVAIWGMTDDIETWSGYITKVSHHPEWVEHWIEIHTETYTTGSGENQQTHTRTWTTDEYDTHHEHWVAHRDFGTLIDEAEIEQVIFNSLSKKFGGNLFTDGLQPLNHGGDRHSGDRNIYSVNNDKGYIAPVTTTQRFENRIKASPTMFSFTTVPTNINVYPWPSNDDWMKSDRLLGTASVLIDIYKFDRMNSLLGPRKKVNVIMVGFVDEGPEYGQWQQAKWIGGKKNDLVLCFGGATTKKKAEWAYVFGWTENELVKNNLQSILMSHPINNDILPLIVEEINKNYVIKDWSKFDYISVQPPIWSYWTFVILLVITQAGLYIWFHKNDFSKSGIGKYYARTVRWSRRF